MLKTYEPKTHLVITKDLLMKLGNEQQSKKRRRRTITSFEQIEQMRLEFLNILRIDCLWPLTNLVKLKLNNNAIEKIENLEYLINLCELDLSFNRIKTMENMEALKNLHILSFYGNQITVVEGIDHMQNLAILSLGKNLISDNQHVYCLRKLKGLRSLNMTGNPCTEQNDYLTFLYAMVPHIIYYGYKIIPKKKREEAIDKHGRIISNLLEKESKEVEELERRKDEEEQTAKLSECYVEYLNNDYLFDQLFQDDEEGRQIVLLNQETEAAYKHFKKSFSSVCHELFDIGMQEDVKRREEVKALESVINEKVSNAIIKSRRMMEAVKGKRVEISVRVTQLLREAALGADATGMDDEAIDEIDKIANQLSWEFNEYITSVWTKLMSDEMFMHEQIEEISKMFEINITDMVNAFLELAQDYFAQLRNIQTEYNDNISPVVMVFLNSIEDEDKTPFMRSLSDEKDALSNCLSTSHFLHLQIIDDRQDTMLSRLKGWQSTYLKNLTENETNRSRSRILELTSCIEHHRENATVSRLLGQQSITLTKSISDISSDHEGEEYFEDD